MSVSKVILALMVYIVEVQGGLYSQNIKFYIYPVSGPRLLYTQAGSAIKSGCNPKAPWAFIVHGWLGGTIRSTWVLDLVNNLRKYRGGCIIAIDYSYYADNPQYFEFVERFEGISGTFLLKVKQLLSEGFSVENGYMFGFSFGSHLVYYVGTKLGGRIPRIDTCEPTGFGFDWTPRYIDPKRSGKNVQCMHTSIIAGTTTRECHQNWLLGNCGVYQEALQEFPKGSHGLCPHIYNSAFKNSFYAEPRSSLCFLFVGRIASYPDQLRMGYTDKRISQVRGSLFTQTYKTHNYADPSRNLNAKRKYYKPNISKSYRNL